MTGRKASAERRLDLELPVKPTSVSAARRAAGDFADSAGASRADVELAVSEAVGNSVVHAYPSDAGGTIFVQASVKGSDLVIVVRDAGTGLRPNLHSKGLGLGIPLIASLSDDYRLEETPGGGAMLTMTFSTGGAMRNGRAN